MTVVRDVLGAWSLVPGPSFVIRRTKDEGTRSGPGTKDEGRRTVPCGDQDGQAFTETMVVSWMLLIFLAGMWQLFIVNDTLFRSITAAHAIMFKKAFDRSDKDSGWKTDYSTEAAVVIWARPDMPEAEFP